MTATATPAVFAAFVARQRVTDDALAQVEAPRLAYSTSTGETRRTTVTPDADFDPLGIFSPVVDLYRDEDFGSDRYLDVDPYCFVCNRPKNHFGDHDHLVEAGQATYGPDGSVHRTAAWDDTFVHVLNELEYRRYAQEFPVAQDA